MSESDDETAFASADEGEEKKSLDGSKNETKHSKSKTAEAQQEAPGKGIEKKDTGQQQQKQAQKSKKKGNRSNQTSAKDSKLVSKPSSKAASASSSQSDVSTKSSPSTVDVKKENETALPQPEIKEKKTSVPIETGPVQSLARPATSGGNEKSNTDLPAKSKGDSQKHENNAAKAGDGDQEKAVTENVENTQTMSAEPPAERKQNTQTKTTETATSPEKQDIPREKMTRTVKQEEVLNNLEATAEKNSGSWGWSSWGSSILSAATSSVQTFTHQVGDGLSTIIDSVESSLGIPDPEELVKEAQDGAEEQATGDTSSAITSQPEDSKAQEPTDKDKQKPEEKKVEVQENTEGTQEEGKKEQSGGSGWFSSWGVSDLAKKVTNTGKSLATKGQTLMAGGFDAVENLAAGGIDVLETIGKKTYNTLSEHDPAFRKTRDFLTPKSNKPNLSSVLREAKDKAEEEAEKARENEEARKAHFGTLFDDNQGLAHLEALEMLSNQSEKKVHSLLNSLSTKDLAEIKPLLISIKETFSIKEEEDSDAVEDQDVSGLVSQCLTQLKLGTASDKLNTVLDMVRQWITDFDKGNHEKDTTKDIHQKSIQALAELTAKGVEQFHKAGELILMEKNKETDFIEKSQSLARLTSVLCHEVGNLATGFVACLNKMAEKSESSDEIKQFVTNIYLEATNSSTYIQDAFVLLLPVVQHAAIEHSVVFRES